MLSFIKRANAAFDKLPEPDRFIWFMVPITTCVVLANIVPLIGWPLLITLVLFRAIGKFCNFLGD